MELILPEGGGKATRSVRNIFIPFISENIQWKFIHDIEHIFASELVVGRIGMNPSIITVRESADADDSCFCVDLSTQYE
jgi:hypothetical protein